MTASLSRRRLLAVGSVAGAGVLLTACTGNDKTDNSGNQTVNNNSGDNTTPGKAIKIGFSAPAADHGDLYELDAIAAAIIGGTALSGGRGTIVGALLGVVIFKGITNLFIVNNLEQEYQLIVKGAIIVAAVLVQQFRVTSLRRRGGATAA